MTRTVLVALVACCLCALAGPAAAQPCTFPQSEMQGCGNCGVQTRNCEPWDEWGPWGPCEGEGCAPGSSESLGCGNCGTQTRTCNGSCQWEGWSACTGEGCAPGSSESQACGSCGTQTRSCNGSCQWEGWSACTGEGCAPGSSETQACGSCGLGTQTRTCTAGCGWGAWSACAGDSAACSEFYVRDWTNSAADHDTGAEPSTDPVYYERCDVWTRQTNTPGTFPGDQPENEPAFAGATNYAFTRVSRNVAAGAGSAPIDVTAEFFFYNLGIGSNWEALGSETLTFAPADLQRTSPGHAWTPPLGISGKKCLGVQISAAGDPYAPPSLDGAGFGGIVQDNNKAQRNIQVVPVPPPPAPAPPSPGMGIHFVVHNPALARRTVVLETRVTAAAFARLVRPTVTVVGGEPVPLRPGGEVRLPDMEPGENRWVRVSVDAVRGQKPVAISFDPDARTTRLRVEGGVTLVFEPTPLPQVLAHDMKLHHAALRRMAALLKKADAPPPPAGTISPERHRQALRADLPRIEEWSSALHRSEADPFAVRERLSVLRKLADSGGDASALAIAHASWLDHLDASLTQLQLAEGDPADIAQTVRWQLALLHRMEKAPEKAAARIAEPSKEFLRVRGAARSAEYPRLIERILPGLQALADAMPQLGLAPSIDALRKAGVAPAALQKAHRGLLLKLAAAVPVAP